MTYKIRGSGDIRQVWDGAVLIGTIQRFERRTATITVRFGVGAQMTPRTVVSWQAQRADGTWVANQYDLAERAQPGSAKAWTTPEKWMHFLRETP